MKKTTRDLSLDLLKGLGCVLRVLAHESIKVGFYRYRNFTFLGGFAPVPFYAVPA